MDRRDFLHPRQLARAAGHALAALDAVSPDDAPAPPDVETALHSARSALRPVIV